MVWFYKTFPGSAAAGIPVESQKDPPYLLSAEAEFSPQGQTRVAGT